MEREKIYLGVHRKYGCTYLSKHTWDCEWYWSLGYVGNKECHWHIDSIIIHPNVGYSPNWVDIYCHFSSTWLTQKQWWILRDLFITAYSFKSTAECYLYGGHNIKDAAPYRVVNPEMAAKVNADLKTILDNIWTFLQESKREYDSLIIQ